MCICFGRKCQWPSQSTSHLSWYRPDAHNSSHIQGKHHVIEDSTILNLHPSKIYAVNDLQRVHSDCVCHLHEAFLFKPSTSSVLHTATRTASASKGSGIITCWPLRPSLARRTVQSGPRLDSIINIFVFHFILLQASVQKMFGYPYLTLIVLAYTCFW